MLIKINTALFIICARSTKFLQDFDFDETLGAVAAGDDIEGVIEMKANLGQQYVETLKVSRRYSINVITTRMRSVFHVLMHMS